MIATTTGLSFWLALDLLERSQPDPTPLVDDQAPAIELRRSARGFADRYTPLPDPSVDMTYLPGLDELPTWRTGVPLTTNSAGFRFPRDFGKKPPNTFRVVLLGDSFIASSAAPFEDGAGPQLEAIAKRALVSKPGGPERVEVYPIGIGGWNVVSQTDFLIHNLHRIDPDAVVHVLNSNDLDSGFGFVLGNLRSATYDTQRVFGSTFMSISSPGWTQGAPRGARGLVGSYLIPESQRRYQIAAKHLARLQDLLQRYADAPYLIHVLSPPIVYGLREALRDVVPAKRILLAPTEIRKHNLRPLDQHPNREGYRYIALSLAHALHDFGILTLDPSSLAEEGPYAPYSAIGTKPGNREALERAFEIDRIPSSIHVAGRRLRPKEAARSVVGGIYRGGVLSPRAALVLGRPPNATTLEIELRFPEVAALDGGTTRVTVDAEPRDAVTMTGKQVLRIPLTGSLPGARLVEVVLESDRYYTEPEHAMIDGVFGYAPKSGRLVRAKVE